MEVLAMIQGSWITLKFGEYQQYRKFQGLVEIGWTPIVSVDARPGDWGRFHKWWIRPADISMLQLKAPE